MKVISGGSSTRLNEHRLLISPRPRLASPTGDGKATSDTRLVGVRKRIRAQLKLGCVGSGPHPAFAMQWSPAAPRRPQSLGAPSAVRIVDAPFHAFGEEAHRVLNGQVDPLAVRERLHAIGLVVENDDCILSEAEDIVHVDPDVIRACDSPQSFLHAIELRSWQRIELEAFRTMIPCGSGPVPDPALAAIKADQVAARPCCPGDTFAVQVHSANADFAGRELVCLSQSGY